MKYKLVNLLLGALVAAGLVFIPSISVKASEMPKMASKGKIYWDNGTKDKSDDVLVYDSSDIAYLYELADPDNDTLWRQEESGIKSGQINFSIRMKNGQSGNLFLSARELKKVETYIKAIRKAYAEGGKSSFSHYAYSDYLTNGIVKGEKDSYTSKKNGTLSICYTDLSGHYQLNDPVRRSDNIALNSGYVRLTGPSSTTGKIMNLGWADYYDSDIPNLIYTTALNCNFASTKETLYTYTDINYKDIRPGSENLPTLQPTLSYPSLLPSDGIFGNKSADINTLLDFVDKTYAASNSAADDYNGTNKLVKIGKLTLSSTSVSALPKSKETKSGSDLREVVISGNISDFEGYKDLSAADLLLTSTAFDYELGDYSKSFFKFPLLSKEAAKDDTELISYNSSTGDVSFTFLLETKKNQKLDGYTIDGEFDLYASFTPTDYEALGSYVDKDNPELPGVYDGFGKRIYTWDEMLAKGLDINGVDSCQKNLLSVLNEDGVASAIRLKLPSSFSNIGYGAFQGTKYISSISFEEGNKSLGELTFASCNNLRYLDLPDSLEVIGASAFGACTSLRNVRWGTGLQSLENSAFYNCTKLGDFDLSNTSLVTIGPSAFKYCIPKKIAFPETLETLGKSAFESNTYPDDDDSGISVEVHMPDSVKTIGENCFNIYYLHDDPEDYYSDGEAPDSISFYFSKNFSGKALGYYWAGSKHSVYLEDGMTQIGDYICAHASQLTIPDSVTYVGIGAFDFYEGDTLELPENLTGFGEKAFSLMKNVEEITIPRNVTSMGNSGFFNCPKLKKVNFENNPTVIPYGFYQECDAIKNLEDVVPQSVEKLESSSFMNSSITSCDFTMFPSIRELGSDVFFDCDFLTSVKISDEITKTGASVFCYCENLETVELGNGLSTLKLNFRNSKISSINIPSCVTNIGAYCFADCKNLESVIFEPGSSLNKIDSGAFSGCTSLEITIPDGVKTITNYKDIYAFENAKSLTYYGSADGAPWGAKMYNGVAQ